jgi:hypothetical protein
MKTDLRNAVLTALLSLLLSAQVFAQGTAFTYQGRLNASGVAANGSYDLQFTVYDSSGAANVVAGPLTGSGVAVSNGLFTVTLDFGTGVFTGPARWLQIAVRTNGAVTFTNLSPRQALTPSPYAIHAGTASNVVNGAVVKSLNNLRDNVTLAAGANVTLTPSGNTLTIASTGGGSNSLWSLNGTNTYYNGGNVGVGTTDPTTKLTVRTGASQYGVEHTDGARRLSTYLSGTGGWLGTRSSDPLHFFVNDGSASMTVDTTGNVGIGTSTPATTLTLLTTLFDYGLEHTDGNVRLNTYLDPTGGWLGTVSNHRLYFYVNNGSASMTIDTAGNVGIGTTGPRSKLHVSSGGSDLPARLQSSGTSGFSAGWDFYQGATGKGYVGVPDLSAGFAPGEMLVFGGANTRASLWAGAARALTVQPDGNIGIGTATPADKLFIAGEAASGYAIGIEGNARQNRDKGGWVKAMAKVNADASIARQFSAFGGTITAAFGGQIYMVTFPFQVDDRFISVTPFFNNNAGIVKANIQGFQTPNTVRVVIDQGQGGIANEFFVFVY